MGQRQIYCTYSLVSVLSRPRVDLWLRDELGVNPGFCLESFWSSEYSLVTMSDHIDTLQRKKYRCIIIAPTQSGHGLLLTKSLETFFWRKKHEFWILPMVCIKGRVSILWTLKIDFSLYLIDPCLPKMIFLSILLHFRAIMRFLEEKIKCEILPWDFGY